MNELKVPKDEFIDGVFDEGFEPVTYVEKEGRIIAIDLLLTRDDKRYMMTVGTQEYLSSLKRENEEQEGGIPVFVIPDAIHLNRDNSHLKRLKQSPLEELTPYLVPQENGE